MSSTTEALMQMLLGGQGAGFTAASLSDQLAALAHGDSRMAPLIQQMQERLAAKQREAATRAEEESSEPEGDVVSPERPARRLHELKSLARTMYSELQTLRTRNEMLAEALGACHLCWGEDAACSYCAGEGRVGSFVIKSQTFKDVVGPALQQVRQRSTMAKPQSIDKGEQNHAV